MLLFLNSVIIFSLQACGEDQYCLFDAAATNNIAIGIATKETEEEQRTIEETFIPSIDYNFYSIILC